MEQQETDTGFAGVLNGIKNRYYSYKHVGPEYDAMYGGKPQTVKENSSGNSFLAIMVSLAILVAVMVWGSTGTGQGIIALMFSLTVLPMIGIIFLLSLFRKTDISEEKTENALTNPLPSWVGKVVLAFFALVFLYPLVSLLIILN